MNRYRKLFLTLGIVLLAIMIDPMKTFAQLPDAGCDPLDPACPIDGGLSLLIAAGIGLGAKKAYDSRKKEQK